MASRLNEQELEQTLRESGGQRRQVCCRVRANHGVGRDLMTEQMCVYIYNVCACLCVCLYILCVPVCILHIFM